MNKIKGNLWTWRWTLQMLSITCVWSRVEQLNNQRRTHLSPLSKPTDDDTLLYGHKSSHPIEFIPSERDKEKGSHHIIAPAWYWTRQIRATRKTELCHLEHMCRQANHKTVKTNSNVTRRTLDTICMRLAHNQQGGHTLMDLSSHKLITWNIIHEIPVTDVIIKAIGSISLIRARFNESKVQEQTQTYLPQCRLDCRSGLQ